MSMLFSPVTVGPISLKHRVVMAPLTRSRSVTPGDVPGDLMLEYYTQRASDGGLIITEGSTISPGARGWYGAPGIYTDEQVAGWKRITAAVHAKGGRIISQLWHTGRSSHTTVTGGLSPVSASVDRSYWENPGSLTSTPSGWIQPSPHRALEASEIASVVEDYRKAAVRAKEAGFDGVELHGANGYLIDQFLQDNSNKRADRFGGAIENRVRFPLQVVDALISIWGADGVGVRIGPSGKWNSMADSNPKALFDVLVKELDSRQIGYLHVIEPRVKGNVVVEEGQGAIAVQHLRNLFKGTIIAAGGFEPQTAEATLQTGDADLVAFGRYFVSNPDLARRIENGWPLNEYDRDTFYTFDAKGYSDYPEYKEVVAAE